MAFPTHRAAGFPILFRNSSAETGNSERVRLLFPLKRLLAATIAGVTSSVTVDTTVQPKAITFLTDSKLLHGRSGGSTGWPAKCGVRLRQSYLRIAKRPAL